VTTSFAQQVLSHVTSSNTTNTTQPPGLLNLLTHSAAVESVEASLEAEVNSTLNKLQLALSQFIGATQTDTQFLDSLAALPNNALQARDGEPSTPRTYMAAVSPWFFTHYGPNSFNKNVCFCFVCIISTA
jgi:glucan endo-1,3-alpha-glucosidase